MKRLDFYISTPCPDGKNGHRRCRAVVVSTSHGVREGRGRAARHRIANSTFGGHRAAAANEWLPMPSADADRYVSYGEREVADRMNVPLGIGSRREPRGAAPLSQARHASRPSRCAVEPSSLRIRRIGIWDFSCVLGIYIVKVPPLPGIQLRSRKVEV